MFIKFVGHDKLFMSDFNGKRLCFERNVVKEVSQEIYNHIIQSNIIDPKEILIVDNPQPKEQEKSVFFKKLGRPKKRR